MFAFLSQSLSGYVDMKLIISISDLCPGFPPTWKVRESQGKSGKVRECSWSGKVRESQGILLKLTFLLHIFHNVVRIIKFFNNV